MKKIMIITLLVLLLFGCGNKVYDSTEMPEDPFVLSKVDNDKDYVYTTTAGDYVLPDGTGYVFKNIVVNLNSEDASNVNMELRSFIKKSIKSTSGSQIINGYSYEYNYYVTNDYLSLVIRYKNITNGTFGDEDGIVYVLSMENGKIVSNKDILEKYNMSENDLFKKVEAYETEDSLYTIKNMKDNGYHLYVNNDNKLVVLFYEITDDETIKKELILS